MTDIPSWGSESRPWWDSTPDYEFIDFDEPERDDLDHEGTLADEEYDRGEHE